MAKNRRVWQCVRGHMYTHTSVYSYINFVTKISIFTPLCSFQWWRVWVLPEFTREIELFEVQGQIRLYSHRLHRYGVSLGKCHPHSFGHESDSKLDRTQKVVTHSHTRMTLVKAFLAATIVTSFCVSLCSFAEKQAGSSETRGVMGTRWLR